MSLPKNFNRKIVFVSLLLFLLIIPLVKIAQAAYLPSPVDVPSEGQLPTFLQEIKEEYEAEDINLGQFTRFLVDKAGNAGTHALTGVPLLEGQASGTSALDGTIALVNGLYSSPPASSVDYLADLGQNLGLVKPAYAQGTGWHALEPILDLWKLFRSLAYLFLVIIFVAVGFMIMFRAKIDPQTVASIQSALPQLVIALLLITFSYALAGLMFDLMEFGLALINTLIKSAALAYPPGNYNLFELLNDAFGGLSFNPQQISIPPTGLLALVRLVEGILSIIPGGGGSIFTFIIALVVVFTMFKLFFALLSRYVTFLLATIFGPILLLFSAIPGRGNVTWMWLKTLIKSVLAFPAVYGVLAIGAIISQAPSWNVQVTMSDLQAPRMIADIFTDPSIIPNIIGLGILLISPSVPDMIDQAFEKRPGPPMFAAAGQTLRGVIGRLPLIGGLAAGI